MDLEATEAEIEHQRQDLAWQQATQPPRNDDDARTAAPSTLRFPRAAYNMAAAACQLEDIFDTSDPKTNEWLHEARQLLYVTLEQQAKSSASRHRARPSQPMTIANGDRSDAHTLPIGRSGGDSSSSNSDRPWTRGAKPRQGQRRELSPW